MKTKGRAKLFNNMRGVNEKNRQKRAVNGIILHISAIYFDVTAMLNHFN